MNNVENYILYVLNIGSDLFMPKDVNYPPNKNQINSYINSLKDHNIQTVVSQLIKKTNYVSFKNFLKYLYSSFDKFLNLNKDYIIILPENPNTSNYWCSLLFIRYIYDNKKKLPNDIINDYTSDFSLINSSITCLFINDILYNNIFISWDIGNFIKKTSCSNIHICVAGISEIVSLNNSKELPLLSLIPNTNSINLISYSFIFKNTFYNTLESNQTILFRQKIYDPLFRYSIYFDHNFGDNVNSLTPFIKTCNPSFYKKLNLHKIHNNNIKILLKYKIHKSIIT